MSTRGRWITAAGLLACGWLTAQLGPPLWADQQDPKDDKQQQEPLDVRYARAYVKLVEAQFNKLQETNRKLPGTIRPEIMKAVQTAMREANDRVSLAQGDDISDGEIYIAAAKADLREAEEALRKADAANRQFAGTVGPFEVQRLQAAVELARLKGEMASQLKSESPLVRAQWELEQLREQVQELQMIVALLRDRN